MAHDGVYISQLITYSCRPLPCGWRGNPRCVFLINNMVVTEWNHFMAVQSWYWSWLDPGRYTQCNHLATKWPKLAICGWILPQSRTGGSSLALLWPVMGDDQRLDRHIHNPAIFWHSTSMKAMKVLHILFLLYIFTNSDVLSREFNSRFLKYYVLLHWIPPKWLYMTLFLPTSLNSGCRALQIHRSPWQTLTFRTPTVEMTFNTIHVESPWYNQQYG